MDIFCAGEVSVTLMQTLRSVVFSDSPLSNERQISPELRAEQQSVSRASFMDGGGSMLISAF